MKKQHVELSVEFKKELEDFTSKGTQSVKATKRALALLRLNEGKTYVEVTEDIGLSQFQLTALAQKYKSLAQSESPLIQVLFDKPRPGRPPVILAIDKAKITALACSTPPKGHLRWSLRLLADKAVELNYVEDISHNTIGKILKKTN